MARERSRSRGRETTAKGNVLIVDTETTGVDASSQCIEVGAVLYCISLQVVLSEISFLIPLPPNVVNEAEFVNKIPADATRLITKDLLDVKIRALREMARNADCAVAHNAEFDRRWFGEDGPVHLPIKWVCTQRDFPWPKHMKLRLQPKLTDIALKCGVLVDPTALHRALADCRLIVRIFQAFKSDIEALLLEATAERLLVIGKQPREENQRAREAGFKWDAKERCWKATLRKEEIDNLNFLHEVRAGSI